MDYFTKSQKDIMKIIGIIFLVLLIIALIGVGPLLTIWSINTVFGTTILYSFWSWLATAWLYANTFGGTILRLTQIRNSVN